MAKPVQIDDVKKPAAPGATSRPILVSDSSEPPSDPMLAQDNTSADKPVEAPVTHAAKTIQPLDTTLTAATDGSLPSEQATSEITSEATTDSTAQSPVEEASATPEPRNELIGTIPAGRDSEAEVTAAEAAAAEARVAREQELETLIDSRKYNLPIGAKHHRSKFLLWFFIILIVILVIGAVVFYFTFTSLAKHILDGLHF